MSKILEPGTKKKSGLTHPNILKKKREWKEWRNENIIFFYCTMSQKYWPIIYSKLSNKSSLLSVKKLVESKLLQCVQEVVTHFTVCPGSSDPFYILCVQEVVIY